MVETPAAALSVAKVSDTAGAKFSAGESDVAFPPHMPECSVERELSLHHQFPYISSG